jgi:phosphatidylserine decarboxylase
VSSSNRLNLSEWRRKAWIGLLQATPWRAYSRAVGAAAALPIPASLRRPVLGALANAMKIDMAEAEHGLPHYGSLADLFTRRLQVEARTIDSSPETVCCPVDGCVSALGAIECDTLIQAKGVDYRLSELVCDDALAGRLRGGSFMTLYLRPKDYHRIHSPWPGTLVRLQRVGGTLFPVLPTCVRNLDGLFVRNERVVLEFQTPHGCCALVCVGAAAVGAISTPFDQLGDPESVLRAPVEIRKGDEVGAFNLGSTVIVLFEQGAVELEALNQGDEVRVGQIVARFTPGQASQPRGSQS